MKYYAYLQPDEDGQPFCLINNIEEFIAEASESYGIEEFYDESKVGDIKDIQYGSHWDEHAAMIIRFEVIVPRPKTVAWSIDE